MVSKTFLDIVVCPEKLTSLDLADPALIDQLNKAIAAGRLKNKGGDPVEKRLDGGLVREDRAVLYPIVDGIPILLIDEAIPLDQLPQILQEG